jgi:RHS repeat-associated protein
VTRKPVTRRRWRARVAFVTIASVMTGVVVSAPPAQASTGLVAVTLTGPSTATLNTPTTFTGSVSLDGKRGLPNASLKILVDGAVVTGATTGSTGAYGTAVSFAPYGVHTVQSVWHQGDSLEERSALLSVQVIAPLPPGGTSTDLAAASTFLYQGANAPQQGVVAGTITPDRAAVLHGLVRDIGGQPLPGVSVSVVGHPEYGSTSSRPDGAVDLAVDGGQPLTVTYRKSGYLPVDRTVEVAWRDYTSLPDVALPALDLASTTITSGASNEQVAQSSLVTDADGTRRATLLVPPGTSATMTLPDGSEQYLPSLTVRATEVTVGDAGATAMPAELPPASAFTYAVDYTVDQALAAGASRVTFDAPLPAYTDNFLHFPAGTQVPAGYYDRTQHAWIASADGVVLTVVRVTAGKADLDVTGDGTADTAAVLATYGITDAERTALAGLYSAGASLWRVPVQHFTPWDYNWPYGLPPGAVGPDGRPIPQPHSGCQSGGSIIGCSAQTLGEAVPIVGTGMALRYDTSHVRGFAAKRTLNIGITGATVPTDLAEVTLQVSIAGRVFSQTFPAQPNQRYEYTWDGTDVYGRAVQGAQTATVKIGYGYHAHYYAPVSHSTTSGSGAACCAAMADFTSSFAGVGSSPITADKARKIITIYQSYTQRLGGLLNGGLGDVGGWTLSAHHAYDPDSRTLYLGDGSTREGSQLFSGLATIAGTGAAGTYGSGTYTGDGSPAVSCGLSRVQGLTVGPDGSSYLADTGNGVIRKITPDGVIRTVAGGGTPSSGNGDGGPATAARLDSPVAVAITPDGRLLIADASANRIRQVSASGMISTLAGGGTPTDALGDFGPANAAALLNPESVTVADDGTVYLADTGHSRIRSISADGVIRTVAGGGTPSDGLGDGLPGPQALLQQPMAVAAGRNGQVWIADTGHDRLRRLGPDGLISTLAGTGVYGNAGDGGPGTDATLADPSGLAVDATGSTVFIAQPLSNTIRQLDPQGLISTVAGTRTAGYGGDHGVPTQAQFSHPDAVALTPTGQLLIADTDNYRLRTIAPPLPGFSVSDVYIPSADGSEIYQFNNAGRHLRTLNSITGLAELTFGYDSNGRLTSVNDYFGIKNSLTPLLTITRDGSGNPTGIDARFGQHTTLHANTDGYLDQITDPANQGVQLGYGTDGLLASFTDARHNTSSFLYDALGRLQSDTGPDQHATTLTRTVTSSGTTVTATTADGHATSYFSGTKPAGGPAQSFAAPAVLQVQSTTYPSGLSTSVTSSAEGTVTTADPNGTRTVGTMGPDPRFGMAVPLMTSMTQTRPSGASLTLTRQRTVTMADPNNPLSLTTQTDTSTVAGSTSTSRYDATARSLTSTSPAGRSSVTTFNADGLPITAQVGTLAPVSYGYDTTYGRLISTSAGSGADMRTSTFHYGPDGLVDQLTDPLPETISYTRDADGRITDTKLTDNNHLLSGYDNNGNLTSLTPPGQAAHSFSYTSGNQTGSYAPPQVDAGGNNTGYAYTKDRQVHTVTLPDGRTITYSYDSAGRLSGLQVGRGTAALGYDANTGQLSTVSDPGGNTDAFSYDGSLVTTLTATGAVPGTVHYNYDAQRMTGAQVNTGPVQSFGYDADNNITSVGGLSLSYDPNNGYLTSTSIGAVATSTGYDSYGVPSTDSATVNGTGSYAASYTRDTLNRLSQLNETIAAGTTNSAYTYDARGRLTDVSVGGVSTYHYDYDANGNRLSATTPSGSVSATYDGEDRLTRYGGTTYAYNATGQLTTATTGTAVTHYDYDELGHLLSVTKPDSTVISYLYDGRGRRIGKKINGTLVQGFIYGLTNQPLASTDGNGTVTATYTYTNSGTPDLITNGGVTYRVITDHLGSPRLIINTSTGVTAEHLEYDPFGTVLSDTNPGFTPFGYIGGLYDPDTGLLHLGARDYSPLIGRFLTKDPTRFGGGDSNLYAYAGNDPINHTDPTGLCSWWNGSCEVQTVTSIVTAPVEAVYNGFKREIYAYEHGCSYWDSVKYGIEGVLTGGAEIGLMLVAPEAAPEMGGALGAAEVSAEGADAAATTTAEDAATSCANSFTADTPVLMADGKEEPIADVKVGDKVLATDPETGRTESRPVGALIRHSGKHRMVDLTLSDGSKISTTGHHPFWDATTRTFTDAIDLHVGDQVLSDHGRTFTISAEHVYDRNLTAYNLQIDGIHTYYAGTTPVLVHNSCGRPLDAFLDGTGKVHGNLPSVSELSQYNREELEILRSQLGQSIQTRIAKTVQLGADYGHNARLAQEQGLLRSLDSFLAG